MDSALQSFAKHTRHTEAERENRNLLARKFIAAHLPEAQSVWAHIADDGEWVAQRTQSPPFAHYQEQVPSAEAFVELMRDGWKRTTPIDTADPDTPVLGAFCDSLYADPVGQEVYVPYYQDDHWKKRALFFVAHKLEHPWARDLLEAVMRDGVEEPDTVAQRNAEHEEWTKIASYVHEVGVQAEPAEWGTILSGLTELGGEKEAPIVVEEPRAEVGPEIESFEPIASVALLEEEPARTRSLEEWAAEPVVRAWRKSSLLSPATPAPQLCAAFVKAALEPDSPEEHLELAAALMEDHATTEQARALLAEAPQVSRQPEMTPGSVLGAAVRARIASVALQ